MAQRITVPAGHKVLIITDQLASEMLSLMLSLRKGKAEAAAKLVAADLIVALIESGVSTFPR